MNMPTLLHQLSTFASHTGHEIIALTVRLGREVAQAARTMPSNGWALCAFFAAASIGVTLLTARLWPREAPEVTTREAMDPAGVRRMSQRGIGRADIARRTRMSQDAVATILRAAALPGRESVAPTRKSRPRSA